MKIYSLLIILVFTGFCAKSQTAEENFEQASKLIDTKKYKEALSSINSALQARPQESRFLVLKANIMEYLQQFDSAFVYYTRALDADPKNVPCINSRALLLNKTGYFKEAITEFTQALELDVPDSIKLTLYINRGAAKINIRNYEGAYNDFMSAYHLDTLNIGALNNLAAACDEVGKGDMTMVYLNKILAIDSTFVGAYENIGFKYQVMGDYKTAIRYFNKVLTLEADEPLAFSNRGFCEYKLGDYKNALKDVNKSLSLYPSNSYAYKTLALIYTAQHDNPKACAAIQKALDLGFTTMYGEEMEELQKKICK